MYLNGLGYAIGDTTSPVGEWVTKLATLSKALDVLFDRSLSVKAPASVNTAIIAARGKAYEAYQKIVQYQSKGVPVLQAPEIAWFQARYDAADQGYTSAAQLLAAHETRSVHGVTGGTVPGAGVSMAGIGVGIAALIGMMLFAGKRSR